MVAYRWASASFACSIATTSHSVLGVFVDDKDAKERSSAAWAITSGDNSVPKLYRSFARRRNVALMDRISENPRALTVD